MTRPPTTAALRMRTGLNRGARQALLRVLTDAGVSPTTILDGLINREAYGDPDDYLTAVAEVWGKSAADSVYSAVRGDMADPLTMLAIGRPQLEEAATRFLLHIPEPDFLTALEAGVSYIADPFQVAGLVPRVNAICIKRGVPYRLEGSGRLPRFTWTGDATVHEQVIAPALSALDDPRLVNGPAAGGRSCSELADAEHAGRPSRRKR